MTTPDTVGYMVLGYGVFAALMGALVGFLMLRAKRLRDEIATLEALDRDGQ